MTDPVSRLRRFLVPFILVICLFSQATACSLLFAGGDFTDDGANLFVRVEDGDMNDENKLYLVSPAGNRKAGEEYHGCYGYTWTFTHDSYRYISRRDDNAGGPCPDCFSTHDHQPFEEAGTNEFGLTISATESLDANTAIQMTEPYNEEGLNESEITTILLSECKTVREAIDLLKSMVENDGLYEEGFGVMICDQNEQWYAEALANHYFLAIRLPKDVVFFLANVSVIGLIDLDDENIIASDGIIDLARRAGTFAGDAEKHIIDWRRSFNDYKAELSPEAWRWYVFERVALTLNKLENTNKWKTDNVADTNDYVLTNVSEDGNIVPLHNHVKLSGTISLDSVMKMLGTYPLGYSENIETHLYRFYPDAEPELGTVSWSAMDNNQYTVFVPDYPMLITDTWKGYRFGLPTTLVLTKDPESWQELIEPDIAVISKLDGEKPETKDAYEMNDTYFCACMIRDFSGLWHVFPDGWENSYSAVFSALSNYLTYMDPGEEAIALVKERFAKLQQDFETRFGKLTARLQAEKDLTARQEIATGESARMAEEAQDLTLALYRHIVYGEALPE